MSKVLVSFYLLVVVALISACGSAESNTNSNSNVNPAVGTGNVAVDPNNLPEGLSTAPVVPSANMTPGIPDPKNANIIQKGATPTPGIPDPANLRKPFKPGATPTPGIPSQEELRRQMQGGGNTTAPPPVQGDTPMMRKKATPKPQ